MNRNTSIPILWKNSFYFTTEIWRWFFWFKTGYKNNSSFVFSYYFVKNNRFCALKASQSDENRLGIAASNIRVVWTMAPIVPIQRWCARNDGDLRTQIPRAEVRFVLGKNRDLWAKNERWWKLTSLTLWSSPLIN